MTDVLRGHTYKWRCGHWFDAKEGRKKEWSAAAVMQGQPQALELVEAPAGEPGRGGTGGPPVTTAARTSLSKSLPLPAQALIYKTLCMMPTVVDLSIPSAKIA